MKYLFGPVVSRRFGISLGIDLMPFKTCSFDCVYCECQRTTNLTADISEYVSTDEVIAELNEFLANKPKLDVITFSGSGEPTLHLEIGKIIIFLKENYPEYKISVLTNSSLLFKKEVREAILDADIIAPSLDAISKEAFDKISRPVKDITPEQMVLGLAELRKKFKNQLILEIFIIPGLNDNETELSLLKSACLKISPDLIQLNTLDRPGTEKWVRPASIEKLQEIKEYLQPFKVEIIGSPLSGEKKLSKRFSDISESIISTISRRPSTIKDLSTVFGISETGISNILDYLLEKGIVKKEESIRGVFYSAQHD